MLTLINSLQLVLYIALLAMLGQGVLYLLAGHKRASNPFYQIFQILTKPFFKLMRWLMPRQVADSHIGLAAFFVLAILYVAVTLWKIEYCVGVQMVGCKP
jgi:hypothetical protein